MRCASIGKFAVTKSQSIGTCWLRVQAVAAADQIAAAVAEQTAAGAQAEDPSPLLRTTLLSSGRH